MDNMATKKRRMPVEVSEELHRKAKLEATRKGIRLYELVEQAVSQALKTKTNERGRAA
jgi:predicted HicB family RNase H-like nuclease